MYLYVLYYVYVIERINEIDYIKKFKLDDVEGSYVIFNLLVRKYDFDILIYNRIILFYFYRFIVFFFRCVMRCVYWLWSKFYGVIF